MWLRFCTVNCSNKTAAQFTLNDDCWLGSVSKNHHTTTFTVLLGQTCQMHCDWWQVFRLQCSIDTPKFFIHPQNIPWPQCIVSCLFIIWCCSALIAWTRWTLVMNESHNDGTIIIVLGIIIIIITITITSLLILSPFCYEICYSQSSTLCVGLSVRRNTKMLLFRLLIELQDFWCDNTPLGRLPNAAQFLIAQDLPLNWTEQTRGEINGSYWLVT